MILVELEAVLEPSANYEGSTPIWEGNCSSGHPIAPSGHPIAGVATAALDHSVMRGTSYSSSRGRASGRPLIIRLRTGEGFRNSASLIDAKPITSLGIPVAPNSSC